MPPKTKAEYKKELEKNIEIISNIIGGFKLTPEQMEEMLSDERIAAHQKYKGRARSFEGYKARQREISKKYTPAIPIEYDRHFMHMMKDDNTAEGAEYNKELLSNISRDDAIGEKARENYILRGLNDVNKINIQKLDKKTPFLEFVDYCAENFDLGGGAMETQHMLAQTEAWKVKPENNNKISSIYNFGSSAGEVVRDCVEIVGQEEFLTFPVTYLTEEQKDRLRNGIAENKERYPEFAKKFDTYFLSAISWFKNYDEIEKDYQIMQDATKGDVTVTADDFGYIKPPEERYQGGYIAARNKAVGIIEANSKIEISVGEESFQDLQQKGQALKEVFSEQGDKPLSPDDVARLHSITKEYTSSIHKFIKLPEVDKSKDPKVMQAKAALQKSMGGFISFSRLDKLQTNAFYHNEDIAKVAEAKKNTNIDGYIDEVKFLVERLKKTEGNLTANSAQYDKFSAALKDLPNKLKKLNSPEDITFEKMQELLKPVTDAAQDYLDSHKGSKLNSRRCARIKIMNRLKDLSAELAQKNANPGKNYDYRIAEKIFTATALKTGQPSVMLDDKIRQTGIQGVLHSKSFQNAFVKRGLTDDIKLKILKSDSDELVSAFLKDKLPSKTMQQPTVGSNKKEQGGIGIGS